MFLRAFLLRLGFSGLLVSATPVLNRSSPDPAKTLPTIDLGYAVYQASSYDVYTLLDLGQIAVLTV